MVGSMQGGIEWLVDAFGCSEARLRDLTSALAVLDRIVQTMELREVGKISHEFPGPGGVTAIYLLAESHLAIHTFPETQTVTLNTYCCAPRPPAPWREILVELLDAREVTITELKRGSRP
jgi:S-adenosylmethionine decarboxylase